MTNYLADRYPIFWQVVQRCIGYIHGHPFIISLSFLMFFFEVLLAVFKTTTGITAERTFWLQVMAVQGALVMLLSPMLAVGAITVEREHRSLESLFLLPISTPSFILQKLLGACLLPLSLLAILFPLTSSSALYDLILTHELLIGYLQLAAQATAAAAFALLVSGRARNTRTAWSFTYLIIALWIFLTWPDQLINAVSCYFDSVPPVVMGTLHQLYRMDSAFIVYAALTVILSWQAMATFDRLRVTAADKKHHRHTGRWSAARRYRLLPDVLPIFWDDARRRLHRNRFADVIWLLVLVTVLVLLLVICISPRQDMQTWRNMSYYAINWIIALQAIIFFILCPLQTATGFLDDRAERRLDMLFLTGQTTRELIIGRFLGAACWLLLVLLCATPVPIILTIIFAGIPLWNVLICYLAIFLGGLICIATGLLNAGAQQHASSALLLSYLESLLKIAAVGLLCGVLSSQPIFCGALGLCFALLLVIDDLLKAEDRLHLQRRDRAAEDAAATPVARWLKKVFTFPFVTEVLFARKNFTALAHAVADHYPLFWQLTKRFFQPTKEQERDLRMTIFMLANMAFFFQFAIALAITNSTAQSFHDNWSILLLVQRFLVALTAPILAVGAITTDREHRTLDSLFLLPISTRSLILQKFLGACLLPLGCLLVLLPLSLFCAVRSQISNSEILLTYLMLAAQGTTLASFALLMSCQAKSTRAAALMTYTMAVVWLYLCNPQWLYDTLKYYCANLPPVINTILNANNQLPVALVFYAALTGWWLWLAILAFNRRRVSASRERFRGRTPVALSARPPRPLPDTLPVLWDDLRRRLRQDRLANIMLGSTLLICLVPVTVILLNQDTFMTFWPKLGGQIFHGIIGVQAILMLAICPGITATIFIGEHEAKRLDFLFLTGFTTRELVYQKFTGAIAWLLLMLLCSAPIMAIVAATFGGISPLLLLVCYAAVFIFALAFASIGIVASSQRQTVTSALVTSYAGSVLLIAVVATLVPIFRYFSIPLCLVLLFFIIRANLRQAVMRLSRWRRDRHDGLESLRE